MGFNILPPCTRLHEARLGIEEIEARLSKIKWLVNYVEEKVKEK
jgi:hypothetical protein